MRFGFVRVIDCVINRIDRFGLTRIRRCGKGEIGITTFSLQDGDLVIDTTPTTIGSTIIKRPISVNETPQRLTGCGVDRKRALVVDKTPSKRPKGLSKSCFGIIVVVKVYFNLA
jgi:hypothetical protein